MKLHSPDITHKTDAGGVRLDLRSDADGRTGEFAVIVVDAWQGKGIGGNLLEKCLSIDEKQGFESVHGIVLHENRNMLALGKKQGFEAKKDLDAGEKRIVIHFKGGSDSETSPGNAEKAAD
jgi:acetyltransferase